MEKAKVIKVIDGDTFEIQNGEASIRLEGLDAQELNTENGKLCKKRLTYLILGKVVEYEEVAHDAFARIVAQVYIDGISINNVMKRFIDKL